MTSGNHPNPSDRRGHQAIQLRVWQRHHGDGVVAEVSPVAGIGTWVICVCQSTPASRVDGWQSYAYLTDAHAAADALAAATFGHACDASCQQWDVVERRGNVG